MKLFKSMIIGSLLLFSCSALFAMADRELLSAGGIYAYTSNTETDIQFSGPGFYIYGLSQFNKDVPFMMFTDGTYVFPTKISDDGVEYERDYYNFLFAWDVILGGGCTKALVPDIVWLNAGVGFYFSQLFSYTALADTRDTILGVGASVSLELLPAEPIAVELGVRGSLGMIDFQKVRYHRNYMEDEDNTETGLCLNIGVRFGLGVQF